MVDREVQLLERFHSLVVCLNCVAQELMLVVENLHIAFCFGYFCVVSAVPVKRLLGEELRKELCSDAAFSFLASVKLRRAFWSLSKRQRKNEGSTFFFRGWLGVVPVAVLQRERFLIWCLCCLGLPLGAQKKRQPGCNGRGRN